LISILTKTKSKTIKSNQKQTNKTIHLKKINKQQQKEIKKEMKFVINQAVALLVSVSTLSSIIDASGSIRGGSDHHARLLVSITTGEVKGAFCASDGQTCTVNGNVKTEGQIRYGDPASNRFSNWRDISTSNGFKCQTKWDGNSKGFGMDPANNVRKNCYWREGPKEREVKADESIGKCANEGTSCQCLGGQARYGQYANGNKAGDRWTNWIDVEGSTAKCDKSAFGGFDPAKDVTKMCECRDIPTDAIRFEEYNGYWERSCENCDSFGYKESFTFSEGSENSVSEAFMEGWELGAAVSVGYSAGPAGGPEGSVSVSSSISESYERTTTSVITNSREQSNERSCTVTQCNNGSLFRWMIEGIDFNRNPAVVASCNFVCIPHEDQQTSRASPVCPEAACNLFENCQCCLEPWLSEEQRENGENEYLCTDVPTPAPVTPIDNDDDAVMDLDPENIVVTCENTFCSDGSDGTSCSRYGGCCPFLSTEDNDTKEKCYCGTSHEDAHDNKIFCNYQMVNN
jgi:hypothetical protein